MNLPENVVIAALALLALVIVLVPLALRLAGLTGQQIVDVLQLTLQFFLNLVAQMRNQNATRKK